MGRNGETYQRPAPSSQHYILLSLLARTLLQTLQRFYMVIALLLNKGVLQTDAQGQLSYHDKLGALAKSAAKRMLPAEIRLSIRQVTDDDDEQR